VHRLWRPAAQRQVRNAWAMLHAHRSAWTTSSVALVSSATALVNAFLSLRYLQSMDLGVLEEMDGIRNKVQVKLQRQQVCSLSLSLSLCAHIDFFCRCGSV
jgi:hypothetical protein